MIRAMAALTTAAALVIGAAACDDDETGPAQETFNATLTGSAEVPPVTTNATGSATFTVNGSVVDYTVSVSNITGVTAAHIHGPATVDQSVGVLIGLTAPTTGSVSGTLTAGATASVDSVLTLMRAGLTYVNVHTTANPAGEIRGQIRRQ